VPNSHTLSDAGMQGACELSEELKLLRRPSEVHRMVVARNLLGAAARD
jgi:hypothetical protein